ncbi:hypothetical protein Hanom_Chr11g01038621 [Helianthus anomalus]
MYDGMSHAYLDINACDMRCSYQRTSLELYIGETCVEPLIVIHFRMRGDRTHLFSPCA